MPSPPGITCPCLLFAPYLLVSGRATPCALSAAHLATGCGKMVQALSGKPVQSPRSYLGIHLLSAASKRTPAHCRPLLVTAVVSWYAAVIDQSTFGREKAWQSPVRRPFSSSKDTWRRKTPPMSVSNVFLALCGHPATAIMGRASVPRSGARALMNARLYWSILWARPSPRRRC